jgi:hypothetical protein
MKRHLFVLPATVLLSLSMFALPAAAQGRRGGGGGNHEMGERGEHLENHGGVVHGYRGGFGGYYADPFWYGYDWAPYWGPMYSPGYGYYANADGALKLKIAGVESKLAQVEADGQYVGTVDDFNGVFQQLDLAPGAHKITVHAPGYRPLTFDVRIVPGHTITYRGTLVPTL